MLEELEMVGKSLIWADSSNRPAFDVGIVCIGRVVDQLLVDEGKQLTDLGAGLRFAYPRISATILSGDWMPMTSDIGVPKHGPFSGHT